MITNNRISFFYYPDSWKAENFVGLQIDCNIPEASIDNISGWGEKTTKRWKPLRIAQLVAVLSQHRFPGCLTPEPATSESFRHCQSFAQQKLLSRVLKTCLSASCTKRGSSMDPAWGDMEKDALSLLFRHILSPHLPPTAYSIRYKGSIRSPQDNSLFSKTAVWTFRRLGLDLLVVSPVGRTFSDVTHGTTK